MLGPARFERHGKLVAVTIGVVLLPILVWTVAARLSVPFNDRYESFYPSLVEADKDGAITRGWIPDEFMPRSSRSIHEVHDLSPSTEWCAFEFLPADFENLVRNLERADAALEDVQKIRNPHVSWWPAILVGDLDRDKIHKAGFELYIAERPVTSGTTGIWLFAIDRSHGRAFFYFR